MLRSPGRIRGLVGCWGASGEKELGGHPFYVRYSISGCLGREEGLWDHCGHEMLQLLVQVAIWAGGSWDLEQDRGCTESCRDYQVKVIEVMSMQEVSKGEIWRMSRDCQGLNPAGH